MNFHSLNLNRRALLAGIGTTAAIGAVIGAGANASEAEAPAASSTGAAPDVATLPRVKVDLVTPPNVHAHEQAATSGPKVVQFTMTTIEKQLVIDRDGTTIPGMTFDGSVPGPMMVVHEGDYLELTLKNHPDNTMPHNIDFHASTGALGGGGLTLINPGEQVTLRFKATIAGAFVYHCAPGGEMIPWHVVCGMNGAILVLPRDGIKDGKGNPLHYDRIYYVGEQDFYVPRDKNGKYIKYESPGDDYADMLKVMKTLTPTHEVFNGAVGALTGAKAMTAKVGETVMIIHSQANRDTRPHLIGGHGDYVWERGKFDNPPQEGLETWFVAGGSAGVALYKFLQPGLYAYVNHNLIEAADLGATAHFQVEGKWDDDLMKQVEAPRPIA